MSLDKIESVKKTVEVSEKAPVEAVTELERLAPNAERFNSLLGPGIDQKSLAAQAIETQTPSNEEQKLAIEDESVSSQNSGSATDKDRQQDKREKETEVEEIEGVSSKKKGASVESASDSSSSPSAIGNSNAPISPKDLQKQAQAVAQDIAKVKEKLNVPNTDIKPSYRTVLRNHLSHVDDNLKIALSKAGVERPLEAPLSTSNAQTPSSSLKQLMGMLSKSENDLYSLSSSLPLQGGNMNMADLMAIQIKIGAAQRQIELFSTLVSKAMEATKTILAVQI